MTEPNAAEPHDQALDRAVSAARSFRHPGAGGHRRLPGVYDIPVSVFPSTNFPRIVVGVDNGVMPIDQMQVTITRPIEEAVNSVPGLDHVRSVTSRGSAEINLFFAWNLDMFQTLQSVNAALARVQEYACLLPRKVTANRLTFAAFPIMGYSLVSTTASAD